jgi:HEPN domain-containing protein
MGTGRISRGSVTPSNTRSRLSLRFWRWRMRVYRGGPRDDFERALRKRRTGATKDLEDAIIAAAKAVESVLKVLYDEHGVKKPAKHELAGLFNGLARPEVAVLTGYVQQLVLAVGEPRNHMAGHGPGSDVRDVPEDLADASIAAAATAISYLAHQLP